MISQHYFSFAFYIPRILILCKNWDEYLYNYVFRKKRPAEYVFRNGLRLIDNAGTMAGTLAVVFVRREYGVPRNGKVIVDIGANMGCFSIFAAEVNKGAVILCYEPELHNYEMLKENILVNDLQNRVSAYQCAIAGDRETKEMNLHESPLNSLVIGAQSLRRQTVNCIMLSDIISNNNLTQIDFLKINCEGAEYDIIERCPDVDIRKVQTLRLEYHNIDDETRNGLWLAEHLKKRGFAIKRFTTYRKESGFIWACRDDC
jgi:FkbM family methyltransferase